MKIVIGNDHAGFSLKHEIVDYLQKKGHVVIDKGTGSKESVDYPDYVHPAMVDIESKKAQIGVLICGSANGVAMSANKHKKIRAAVAWNTTLAALARQHNNANVICLPARFINSTMAKRIVGKFISAKFEGGRHSRRVKKISQC